MGFPGVASGKEPACQCRLDIRYAGLTPGWEDPLEKGMLSLQHSCLENPMDRGAWRAPAHGVTKSRIRLSDLSPMGETSVHVRHSLLSPPQKQKTHLPGEYLVDSNPGKKGQLEARGRDELAASAALWTKATQGDPAEGCLDLRGTHLQRPAAWRGSGSSVGRGLPCLSFLPLTGRCSPRSVSRVYRPHFQRWTSTTWPSLLGTQWDPADSRTWIHSWL